MIFDESMSELSGWIQLPGAVRMFVSGQGSWRTTPPCSAIFTATVFRTNEADAIWPELGYHMGVIFQSTGLES
ncbi:hypothetical protein JMJ77_0010966 [Colletotrichum scovillei]|uniref:Uncharacterized protein n=1 Tax=Colletotrichum scovillei TaxID=1209932 RepID=A0A9P7U9M1_9PEZI|nr:hypothetical protein JMJ77_0010966 [Colletotrichum scovillei]KAG7059969.1 hypothetical protein JMJ78_0015253 [Colletotrichum scovillei]KAG7067384.1 hypothetical protein JMJ76_0008822 [Colletotrichum scovillei]